MALHSTNQKHRDTEDRTKKISHINEVAVGGRGTIQNTNRFIGSAIVAMAAAIVTIANVVMAAVVEPQQSWS